jgi:hypothetical protein
MDPEDRFYYDEEGNFLGYLVEGDPIPPEYGAAYTLVYYPGYPNSPKNYKFNGIKWVIPFSTGILKDYRDVKTAIDISVVRGSFEFNVKNDQGGFNALLGINTGIPLENNPSATVSWKNLDGQYVLATYADMGELFYKCYRRQQDCRNAERAVLEANAVAPYIDIDDAYADFDNELGE